MTLELKIKKIKLKKEIRRIKQISLKDIKYLFEHEERENYYKPVGKNYEKKRVMLNIKLTVI